jgi:hypothetical protein
MRIFYSALHLHAGVDIDYAPTDNVVQRPIDYCM